MNFIGRILYDILTIKVIVFIMLSGFKGNRNAPNKRPPLCLQTLEIVESKNCFSPVQKQIRKIHNRSISPLSLNDRAIEPLPAEFLTGISKTFVITNNRSKIKIILKTCYLEHNQLTIR